VTNDLVTVRGRLTNYFGGSHPGGGSSQWREVLRLEQDGDALEVVLEQSSAKDALAGFKENDLLEVTGIVQPEDGTPAVRLRLRELTDIRSLGPDPTLTRSQKLRYLLLSVGAVALVLLWVWQLRRTVASKVADLAQAKAVLEREVEERRKAEAELDRALAAEREVGELKSRFVSLVSHEFRTPLGITMSAVELLRNYLDRLSPAKRNELLEDIHLATLRMSSMMEQVLLLGKVEAGKITFRSLPIHLAELGEKLADESISATSRKCAIYFTAENDVSGAMGDESLLRHTFSNLLSNAAKYTDGDHPVEFTVRREGDSALFTVCDRGIGIPQADQTRLFEAFHRARNVGETPGTGLGLLIVKRCVEMHHGTISFSSTEGQGTEFYVRLPLFAQAAAAIAGRGGK
jgi:signal transduction histidine kinase